MSTVYENMYQTLNLNKFEVNGSSQLPTSNMKYVSAGVRVGACFVMERGPGFFQVVPVMFNKST
jgi:hypothetical protein